MPIDNSFLDSIFASDEMGLIDKVEIGKVSKKDTFNLTDAKEREVADWIEKNGRDPDENAKDVTEHRYAVRLKKIRDRNSAEKKEDVFDPLSDPALDSMIAAMDIPDLEDFTGSVIKQRKIKPADYISNRTHIDDFSQYEPLFNTVQAELEKGVRKAIPFSASGMRPGRFYIAGGLLCFIDEVYDPEKNSFGRLDSRLHVVFANHTESYMLFATLQKIMSEENGRAVTAPIESVFGNYNDALIQDDIETGYIYVLRSLSTEPELKKYGKDFYKVGYTGGSVEKRISNAVNEPTYLCAPVQIVEKWRCTNINAKALETFLHKFLDVARIKIKVNGKDKSQVASEWFNVPLGILEAMVPMILDGSIVNYRYDPNSQKLIRTQLH